MALKIAFLAYDVRCAGTALSQLVEDNADQVAGYNRTHGRVFLRDGAEIISANGINLHGRRFDQVIIADDRRLQVMGQRHAELRELDRCCQGSTIPEEFRYQIYDLDEEDPNHGKG